MVLWGRVRKIFMPRNLNALGTIFGGDLLEWMESAAVTCARHFLRNPEAISIAMDRVFFHSPVRPDQMAELSAYVVSVGNHTVQVKQNPPAGRSAREEREETRWPLAGSRCMLVWVPSLTAMERGGGARRSRVATESRVQRTPSSG
jgi:acyl-CoA hydrolase